MTAQYVPQVIGSLYKYNPWWPTPITELEEICQLLVDDSKTQHWAIWSRQPSVRNAEAPKLCQKHWTSPKGKQTLPWKKHFYNSLRSQDSFAAGQHYATQHQTGATFKVIAQGAGLSRPIRQQSSRRKMAVKKCSVTSKKVGKNCEMSNRPVDEIWLFHQNHLQYISCLCTYLWFYCGMFFVLNKSYIYIYLYIIYIYIFPLTTSFTILIHSYQ